MIGFVGTVLPILENRTMGCHGNHAFSHSTNKCFRAMFLQIGGQMNNMAYMRNCPEGCMVGQIRSRGNCNFYLPLFSLKHHLDLIKNTDFKKKLFQMP